MLSLQFFLVLYLNLTFGDILKFIDFIDLRVHSSQVKFFQFRLFLDHGSVVLKERFHLRRRFFYVTLSEEGHNDFIVVELVFGPRFFID